MDDVLRDDHFNPTRVRLKLDVFLGVVIVLRNFNPTRVRLKPVDSRLFRGDSKTSTPQGCV